MSEQKTDSDAWVVFVKTQKGVQEIQDRTFKLPQKLRTILILIDGQKTKGAIVNQFSKMEAAESLVELERQGFIAKKADVLAPGQVSPEEEQRRVELAKTFMINTVRDAVGPTGSSLIEGLKNCTSRRDIDDHLENYLYVIKSGRGKSTADQYEQELKKLFASGTD